MPGPHIIYTITTSTIIMINNKTQDKQDLIIPCVCFLRQLNFEASSHLRLKLTTVQISTATVEPEEVCLYVGMYRDPSAPGGTRLGWKTWRIKDRGRGLEAERHVGFFQGAAKTRLISLYLPVLSSCWRRRGLRRHGLRPIRAD